MKNLHPIILRNQERWKGYHKDIELLNDILYILDGVSNALLLLNGVIETSSSAVVYTTYLTITVEHTNAIALCLGTLIDHLGSITYEFVQPEDKTFKYDFGSYDKHNQVEVSFCLKGDSCRLVKVREEIIPAYSKPIYELQCGGKAVKKEDVK